MGYPLNLFTIDYPSQQESNTILKDTWSFGSKSPVNIYTEPAEQKLITHAHKLRNECPHKKESKSRIICVGLKKKLANEREMYTTINHQVIYILPRGWYITAQDSTPLDVKVSDN